MDLKAKLNYFYHSLCIICVISLVSWSLYLYLQDDDTTQVEYHQFHSHDGTIYPSISFCLKWPISTNNDVWKQFINSNNTQETKQEDFKLIRQQYRKFVDGRNYSKMFAEADYDTLTMDLNMFVKGYYILLNGDKWVKWKFRNGSYQIFSAYIINEVHGDTNTRTNLTETFVAKIGNLNTYVSERRYSPKCFTFDTPWIPEEKIKKIELWIRPQLFPHFQKYGTIPLSSETFSIHYHYPFQKMKSLTKPNGWRSELTNSTKQYVRKHYIGNVEVLKRRNKDSNPCLGEQYDEKIILSAAQKVGCKHPISKINSTCRNCENKDDIRAFNHELYDVDPTIKHMPPCRSLISLSEWQGEESKQCTAVCGANENPALGVHVIFNDYIFREIVYNKVFSLGSLLGNSGGYIGKDKYLVCSVSPKILSFFGFVKCLYKTIYLLGMFLGYAIVQLPGFFFILFGWVKSRTRTTENIEGNENRSSDDMTPQFQETIPVEFGYKIPRMKASIDD